VLISFSIFGKELFSVQFVKDLVLETVSTEPDTELSPDPPPYGFAMPRYEDDPEDA